MRVKRTAWIGALLLTFLGASVLLSKCLHTGTLTSSELATTKLAPAVPDDSCGIMQRTIGSSSPRIVFKIDDPLSSDELAIYRAVLSQWNGNSSEPLNVADRTFALDRDVGCECLKGMDIDDITMATRAYHTLSKEILAGKARLVDPKRQSGLVAANDPDSKLRNIEVHRAVKQALANGLFRLSEIAFNKERNRAIVGYSFVCGSLCGSGGRWVFEKKDGEWKKSDVSCGGWIS